MGGNLNTGKTRKKKKGQGEKVRTFGGRSSDQDLLKRKKKKSQARKQ